MTMSRTAGQGTYTEDDGGWSAAPPAPSPAARDEAEADAPEARVPEVERRATAQAIVRLIAILLLLLIILPLATPLFIAAVLAGALFPLCVKLTVVLRGRKNIAAFVVTAGAVLLLLGPFAALVAMGINQAQRFADAAQVAAQNGELDEAVARLPQLAQGPARSLVDRVRSLTGPAASELTDKAPSAPSGSVAGATSLLGATSHSLLMLGLTFVALFFLLVDGRALISWLDGVLPLPQGQFRSILKEFRRVSKSVLVASGATAALQAVTGFIGLLIGRVPNPVFFSLLVFFLALIPAVGAASSFVVLGLFYLLKGSTGTGIFLIAWGVLVVGLIDNVAKPFFIKDASEMHGGLVFFSLIGGLATFGIAGLIAGPLALAFFLAVIGVERERRQLSPP